MIRLLALTLALGLSTCGGQPVFAQGPRQPPRAPVEHPIGGVGGAILDDIQGRAPAGHNALADFFAKWADEDLKGAADLAIAIPDLQDPVGKACWDTFASMGALIKAHPLPATLKLASDIQAARLFLMAVKKVCQKPECSQVWNDLQNQVAALAPIPAPVSLSSICAKIP